MRADRPFVQDLGKRISSLEALRHPALITDSAGIVTYWNSAAERELGWPGAIAVGRPLRDLLPVDATPDEVIERLLTDADWSGEIALRRQAGTAFLARVHAVPLDDGAGNLTGVLRVVIDITDAMWSQRRELELGQRAREALAAGRVGAWYLDGSNGLATWDETMEALFGLEPGSFPGTRDAWADLIHEDDRDWALEEFRRASAASPGQFDVEYRVNRPAGDVAWIRVIGHTLGANDPVGAATGVALDVTERRRADEERTAFLASERARRDRFTLLAEASGAFAESLDEDDVIAAVGRLVVPRLADWFALDLGERSGVATAVTFHSDPARQELTAYLGRRFGGDGVVPQVRQVIARGGPELVEHVDLDSLTAGADPEYRAVLENVGLRSLMVVPLTARGRTFGTMTFAIGESDLAYSQEDLGLAEELAGRAALSLDNARLFADRSHVARVLQRSLLPPDLPEVPGVQLAARYRAAEIGSDIGGDFYDVFQTAQNRWSAVLGDVSGKGTDAAVLTGLARHTLRAAAIRAPGPVEVLSALNHAILAPEYGERFVTVAYVQMALDGDVVDLIVSSAGHPSPLIVRSDGRVEEITGVGGIIGLFEDVVIEHETTHLQPADMLVLYTDGVLEARDAQGEFFGDERLQELLAGCAGMDAAEVARRIEDAAIAFQNDVPRDDIAILVVRMDDTPARTTEEHRP